MTFHPAKLLAQMQSNVISFGGSEWFTVLFRRHRVTQSPLPSDSAQVSQWS